MNQFGKCGLPVGTTIRITSVFDKSLLGRKHTIVMPLQYHCGLKRWVYAIDLEQAGCSSSWIESHQIELVELPLSWYNYCYNKITLLLEHNDNIAADLALEKQRGDWK